MGKAVLRIAISPLAGLVSLVDKKAGAFLFQAVATAAAFIPGVGPLISAGMQAANAVTGAYRIGGGAGRAAVDRLSLTFDAEAPRKLVLGTTAMATDAIYAEPSAPNSDGDQEYVDYIIVCAAHKVHSIDEIWTDSELMWSATGGVASRYSGYLTVTAVHEGSVANGVNINGGTIWNATDCPLTGCAYVHLRIKRTGNGKKAASPFASGLSGRMTIRGRGMPCYDPRQDSTRGGSGSHRADDQTTWTWGAHCDNHAIQSKAVLLGWRIGGELSVGAGLPPARLDFADFIAAANICDEDVALDGGGTQNRYEGGGIFQDSDSPGAMLDVLMQAMNAELRDVFGRVGIRMKVDDLAAPQLTLTEADVLGGYDYSGQPDLSGVPNIVRGRYIDSTDASLYQPVPYEEWRVASADGVNRTLTLDLPMVQNPARARRIAKQVFERQRLGGSFEAEFGPRAWALRPGDPVKLTFPLAGLSAVQFRVARQEFRVVVDDEGARAFCPMLLERDDASVYAWTAATDEAVPEPAIAPVVYDPTKSMLASVEASAAKGASASVPVVSGLSTSIYRTIPDDGKARATAAILVTAMSGTGPYTVWLDIQYRVAGGSWTTAAIDNFTDTVPTGGYIEVTGDVTNISGTEKLYEFRTEVTVSAGDSISTISAPESFLTVI